MSRQDKQAKIYFVWFFLFVALVAGGISYFKEPDVALNKNNCPRDSKLINDYALIVVDETDPIVGEYQDEILSEMETVSRNLPKYGKFSLHDITTGKTRLASSCAPASDCNLLVENCDRQEHRYQKNFLGEILGKTEGWFGSAGKSSDKSLLIQRLAEISSLSDFKNTENRSIHIFSDMLQHDSGYSHHRRRVGDDEFAWLIQQPFYQQNKPELEGVSVYVYYLKRNKYRGLQTPAHKKFWKELFEDAGAAQVSLREINLPGEDSAVAPAVIDNRPTSPPKLVAPKPKPESASSPQSTAPKLQPVQPNPSPEQQKSPSALSPAEESAQEYRERFVRYHDAEALSNLLDLHLQNLITPESDKSEIPDRIYRVMFFDGGVPPETRGKVGELMLVGGGGLPKDIKIAYLLMRCAGGYQEKIRLLRNQISPDDIEFGERDLTYMRSEKLCKQK